MINRPILLVPGATLWRSVLHYEDKPCEFMPDCVPLPGPRANGLMLRVQMHGHFVFEPELIGGLYRGAVAFIEEPTIDPNWTHASVLKVLSSSIIVKIEPPMKHYLTWRKSMQQTIIQSRSQALDQNQQINIMQNVLPPDGVKRTRIWVGATQTKTLTI